MECYAVGFVYIAPCICYTLVVGFKMSPRSSEKLPSAGGLFIFVNMFTFHLYFHTVAVKSPLTIVVMSDHYIFGFFPESLGSSF
jgi:hypothetical protein